MTSQQHALLLTSSGLSVVPVSTSGDLTPIGLPLAQAAILAADDIAEYFCEGINLAVVCGPISGNLEVLNIQSAISEAHLGTLLNTELPGFLATLPQVVTPHQGRHLYYRCPAANGGDVLASGVDGTPWLTVLGEGQYAISVGTDGYTLANGQLTAIPTITPEQRDTLHAICRQFNQSGPFADPPTPPAQPFQAESNVRKFRRSKTKPIADMETGAEVFLGAQGGNATVNLANVIEVIEANPKLSNSIWYDEFLDRILTGSPAREWADVDDLELTLHLQRRCAMEKMTDAIVAKAVIAHAGHHTRNCVKDWLEAIQWDQESRLGSFFEDAFGSPRSAYHEAVSRNFWLSMIARIYQPGCKVDNMVVLEGKQGAGKSHALRIIGGDWFTEQHESASHSKAFAEVLQGKMLVEISEMDAFRGVEVTRIKQVVSNQTDRYRGAYERRAKDRPRQCIFVGTTNRDDWSRDETGARRFWPIRCTTIDLKHIRAWREQYFAEAVALYRTGATWWEVPEEDTRREQEDRLEDEVWLEPIAEFLALKTEVTLREVLEGGLKADLAKIQRSDQLRVGAALRRLGWEKFVQRQDGILRKAWRRV